MIAGLRPNAYPGVVVSPAAIQGFDPSAPPFDVLGPVAPLSPVILSVPHAGRDYPPSLIAALRVPLATIRPLEDRHVDAVARAARGQETMLIQRRPRAWIDLNRAEQDRDPRVETGGAAALPAPSARAKGGLGLIPRRVTAAGDIWRRPFAREDVLDRITRDHRSYHQMLAQLLAAARARFGVAVLIDLHSMPPLGPAGGKCAPRLVFGDRFGKSARARVVARMEQAAAAHGFAFALNSPYAGGHILDRHGDPAGGVHAVQVELDRSLYLDAAFDQPVAAGVAACAALVRAMIDSVAEDLMPWPIAAE